MRITPHLFEAFLNCATKCYLRSLGENGGGNTYADWEQAQNESYRIKAEARFREAVPEAERAAAPTSTENLKAAKWRLTLDLTVCANWSAAPHVLESKPSDALCGQTCPPSEADSTNPTHQLESHVHAAERVPSEGRGKPVQFVPVRFVFRNKLAKEDRLLLGFDALVLSESLGSEVSVGKMIHGDDHATLKVKLPPLISEARKLTAKVAALLASSSPPDLVLNRHCPACEFRDRCRRKALEKDDLSLLGGMTEKERKQYHSKGIFTVTQLSYTFRPRRQPKRLREKREKYHHSLKALAIREKKIHIVGSPELKIEGTPVYLDVEGLPDRDFYYLIGARIGNGGAAIQHCLWADRLEDEKAIWHQFLDILANVKNPVLVHYGSYEIHFLTRMSKRYGEPPGQSTTAKLVKSSVNLLSVIYARIYFPAFSNGLKDTAGFFGFQWTDSAASGLGSIGWRDLWESAQDASAKERLLQYNTDDCTALMLVVVRLQVLTKVGASNAIGAVETDNLMGSDDFGRWGQRKFAVEDFRLMADCAYFDYQRSKVYVRSNPEMKNVCRRKHKRGKLRNRPNRIVILRARQCWRCKSSEIIEDSQRWHRKLHLDLRISTSGIKRWITEFRAPFYRCPQCNSPCLARSYKSMPRFGHSLLAWVVHQHLTNRISLEKLEFTLKECFGIYLGVPKIHGLKYRAARYYRTTYNQILKNIMTGHLVHADETRMKLSGETGYVWVFTSLVDVAYLYRPTREGEFLQSLLNGFGGVLVSDFYAVYDALPCKQQKCLVHLMWDINSDLLKNPFDEDLKHLASQFGELLRSVIRTVDRFGLKARFLRKHKKGVAKFYRTIEGRLVNSDVAQHYRDRFLKHRNKLFTFLDHDGIPWNNNNAE